MYENQSKKPKKIHEIIKKSTTTKKNYAQIRAKRHKKCIRNL